MCLIAFASGLDPRFPLVLAANRDEFYERPSARAGWWSDATDVYGGRDLSAGGSWLAINRRGRLAALTNVRDGLGVSGQRSRGALVAAQVDDAEHAVGQPDSFGAVAQWGRAYAGFNLLRIDLSPGAIPQVGWCSNRRGSGRHWAGGGQSSVLAPGLHALSNATIDVPWPKSRRLAQAVEQCIGLPRAAMLEALFAALGDQAPASDDALPDTGVGVARERMLSPVFIAGDGYGTRTSTVVLVDQDGRVDFVERDATPGASAPVQISTHFQLDPELQASGRPRAGSDAT